MRKEIQEKLDAVNKTLNRIRVFNHAYALIEYDKETVCPEKGMIEEGEVGGELANMGFQLSKDEAFIADYQYLYEHIDEIDNDFDQALVRSLHKEYERNKNITPEMNKEFSSIFNESWVNWLQAKKKADFSIFSPSLKKVKEVTLKEIEVSTLKYDNPYDALLDTYEPGMTTKILDEVFGECKARLIPLLKEIQNSKKKIRSDFLSRKVSDAQQEEFAKYLLRFQGFDFKRGCLGTTEHPFTNGLSYNDVRVTTHYYPDVFTSSMYSIIHEGGHALFEQNQPKENYEHNIENLKTMGMHESVSRFYENLIGRSEGYIHAIYPEAKRIFPNVLGDVSEQEFYEGVNLVTPSLIRTEADEFTYTFHIIIRYEIEKEIVNHHLDIDQVEALWDQKYQEYLGIKASNSREGVLQDGHWASGFGYFPAYALGNMYNAMYFNKMKEDIPVEDCLRKGDLTSILDWMKKHVFLKADRLDYKAWLKEITGREFGAKDYLDYLETKYRKIYGLEQK